MRRISALLLSLLVAVGLGATSTAASGTPPDLRTRHLHGRITTSATIAPPAVLVTGRGPVSGMGMTRTTSTQTLSGDPTAPQVGDVITSTDLVMRAADGDELHADYVATVTSVQPPRIAFAGTVTVTGGTGRFAGAAGTLDTVGGFDFATMQGFFTLDGPMTLPRR